MKKQIKQFLDMSSLPFDHWQHTQGMLSAEKEKWWGYRFFLVRLLLFFQGLARTPIWLLRLPAQTYSILREFETLHFAPFRKVVRGQGCVVDRQTWLINGENIILGDFVKVSAYSSLMAGRHSTIRIGTNTIMSTGVVIVTFNHGYASRSVPMRYQPWVDLPENSIEIGTDVWVGANVTILPGSRIGDGAIIGAGSLVRGEVPPRSVYLNTQSPVIRERKFTES